MQSQSLIQKYELPLFLLLTYALSWWSVPFAEGRIIPHGPALAALIVLGLAVGKQGLGEWWRRVTHWRVPFVWYLAGPAVILGYHAIGFVINLLLGAQLVSPPQLSTGTFLMLLFVGGLWEEPGWSGYLLPKMKERFANLPNGSLIAALVTGLFRSIWHLPLFLYGHMPWFDIFIFSFAFQLLIAWVLYRSGGSVPTVMVLHFVSNLMGSLSYPLFTGAEHTAYSALFMAAATLFSLILVLKSQFKTNQPIYFQ
ncbi:MAG: CPBP family intramembrane metalloprotease [Chloroflexi bacterium]|nr:CPBP family intramembrane metalloprotease [Chloroflexota bacterium]